MGASGIKRSCSQLGNAFGCIGDGVARVGVLNEERGDIQLNGHPQWPGGGECIPPVLLWQDLHCLRQCNLLLSISALLCALQLAYLSTCLRGRVKALRPMHKTW